MMRPLTDSSCETPHSLSKPPQAASTLAICEKTLWSITEPRGDLPRVRIGRSVRYDPADLRAWIEKKKGGSDDGC